MHLSFRGIPGTPRSRLGRTLQSESIARDNFADIEELGLRVTCNEVALLLSHNVNPKAVSEMLGHANIAITLDTY